ncbi:MAG: PAS domain-containing protein [Erythrobacter sp.]|uniref:PAS domain-containing sensor histidine kinase n=1 Tax=Erythrobacter sp. TaxID=1042 RepID=UPI0025FBBE17|nr:ATP-binding protein [Erythrobacter sp.]MCL9997948.1 PAS domain-containing protein [Erythrobacter sp.]
MTIVLPGTRGEWIQRQDWSDHAFGPLDQWPIALRLLLASIFRSNSPKLLFWGDDHVAFYNDAFAALSADLGIAELGQPFCRFGKDIWQPLEHPLERAMLGASFQSARVRFDGADDQLRRCLHLSLTPMFDPDERPAGVLVDAQNCAHAGHTTDGMLLEHSSLQVLLAEAPIFVAYGTGSDFKIEFANKAFQELFGTAQDEAPTPPGSPPVPEWDQFQQTIQRCYSSEIACSVERAKFESREPQGSAATHRYADFHCNPIKGADGKIAGVLCTGIDVTEKVLAQKESDRLRHQVLHASRINAMGTMAMTLAHELNQPLAAAINFAGASRKLIASEEAETRARGEAMLGRTIDQVYRAGEIIRRMRSIIRSGAANRQPICVDEAAIHAWQLLATETADFTFDSDIAEDARLVLADAIQLEQILINLFRNAIAASQDAVCKRIELSAQRAGSGTIRLRVRDYGCGLPETAADDFLSTDDSRNPEGLGVGLLLARTLASANGGSLHAFNAKDAGAVFDITLEAAD